MKSLVARAGQISGLMLLARLFLALLFVVRSAATNQAIAACDATRPAVTAVALSPPTVDASSGDMPVTCSMSVRDVQFGVQSATCHVRSLGDPRGVRSCTASSPSSGNRHDGVFACSLTTPRFAPAGSWPVWVDLTDQAGNLVQGALSSASLSVTSTPSDFAAPNITGLQLTPSALDTSSADRTLTCTMTFSDALSGLQWARCSIWSPPGLVIPFQIDQACETTTRISGTANAGTYRCSIMLPRSSAAGAWQVRVDVADRADNEAFFMDSQLTSRGLPATVSVTSSPHDLVIPQLVGLDLVPNYGDTAAAPAGTTCRIHATDDLSGIDRVICRLLSKNGFSRSVCESSVPTSGSATDGQFECTLQLPAQAPAGLWTVGIEIHDRVGNLYRPPASGFDSLQFDNEFANLCGGPFDPILRFQPGSTSDLRWTRFDGALRFDVYRGIQAGLVDLNNDGLADDYGQCRNHLDPDLTDGGFTDAELPTTSERAFTYLIGWRDASGNHGIGQTSAGLERIVSSTCP